MIDYDLQNKRKQTSFKLAMNFRSFIQNFNNWSSGSGKKNALLNLIKQEDDDDYSIIDKTYLYDIDPHEAKHQYLIKNARIMFLKI